MTIDISTSVFFSNEYLEQLIHEIFNLFKQ